MLDNPITTKDSHVLESNGIVVGATGMQGWRLEMEVRLSPSYITILIRQSARSLFFSYDFLFNGRSVFVG